MEQVKQYMVGRCDQVFWVLDKTRFNSMSWWRRAFTPEKAAVFTTFNGEEARLHCAKLNNENHVTPCPYK